MIAEQYRKMLDAKSVIRQLSEKATKRAQIIGAENVFDYSLGNPSVPAPAEFKQALLDLIEKEAEKYPCENTVTTWTQTRRMDGALQTP